MPSYPRFSSLKRLLPLLLFCCAIGSGAAFAQGAADGKAIFQANCASCHNPLKDATGPALKGVDGRVPSREWLYEWIHNPAAKIASGDAYANKIYNEWGKTQMTAFPQLSTGEIDAVIKYVNEYTDPNQVAATDGPLNTSSDKAAGNKAGAAGIYTVATLGLLLLVFILYRANQSLRAAAAQKEGVPTTKDIPFYRNKLVIAIGALALLAFTGYAITNGAVEMGRQQNYMPKQPIFYSHKVHVGINQMNCMYCHSASEKSRHAMIPSTNVCMNCHKQINEYTGAAQHPLQDHEGKAVNGTAEIQKLYQYAGWDPAKKDYIRDAAGNIKATTPPWVKIHNLPDHVYFSHAQHVAVGKIACQRCHGPIQEMDEVYQFASLSMGWCINCHRQTQVQFADNGYYSIYEKYHAELKAGQRTGVTVEDIGGIECQKCHY